MGSVESDPAGVVAWKSTGRRFNSGPVHSSQVLNRSRVSEPPDGRAVRPTTPNPPEVTEGGRLEARTVATVRSPKLCLHKAGGRAVVRLNVRDHYLGAHGTPEAQQASDALIDEWLANHRLAPAPPAANRAGQPSA